MFLEERTLDLICKGLEFAKKTGGLPFVMNKKRRRLEMIESKSFHLYLNLNTILLYITLLFIAAALHASTILRRSGRIPDSFWMFWVFFFFFHLLYMQVSHTFCARGRELASAFNAIISLSETLAEKYPPTLSELEGSKKFEKQLRTLLQLLFLGAYVVLPPILCIALPIIYFDSALLLGIQMFETLSPFPFSKSFVVSVVYFVVPLYEYLMVCMLCKAQAIAALVTSAVIYFDYLFRVKIRFSIDALAAPKSRKLVSHPKNAIQVYRGLTLSLNHFLNGLSKTFCVAHFILLLLSSFLLSFLANYRGPVMERLLMFLGFAITMGYATFLLHFLGRFYVLSSQMLDSWKRDYIYRRRGGPKWNIERRVLESLLPIRVYSDSFYFYDQLAELEFWDQVVDKSIVFTSAFKVG